MNCNNNISDNNFGAFLAYRKNRTLGNITKNNKKTIKFGAFLAEFRDHVWNGW